MHVHLRRVGVIAFLAGAGAMLSSACVRDESSIFIRACMSVPRDTCEVQASITAEFISRGTIDGVYKPEYHCLALLENQLVAQGDDTKARTETSRVSFYEADVQVLTTDQPPQLITRSDGSAAEFSVPINGFADPGSGTDPGLGLADLTLLDYATLKDLTAAAISKGAHQTVVASVIVHGRSLGGAELTTNEFKFPVDVCGGCLCGVVAGNPCQGSASNPAPDCLLGQDDQVDCRLLDPCTQLECGDSSGNPPSLDNAHCPANALNVDKSCCGLTAPSP